MTSPELLSQVSRVNIPGMGCVGQGSSENRTNRMGGWPGGWIDDRFIIGTVSHSYQAKKSSSSQRVNAPSLCPCVLFPPSAAWMMQLSSLRHILKSRFTSYLGIRGLIEGAYQVDRRPTGLGFERAGRPGRGISLTVPHAGCTDTSICETEIVCNPAPIL